MKIELVIWIFLPMLLGVAIVAGSMACAWISRSAGQWIAVAAVTSGVAWSEIVLLGIFRGGWPTFVPHIVLAVTMVIVIGQFVAIVRRELNRDEKRRSGVTSTDKGA